MAAFKVGALPATHLVVSWCSARILPAIRDGASLMDTSRAFAVLDAEGHGGEATAKPETEKPDTGATRIPPRVHAALRLLLESHDYAQDLETDLWEFAVELKCL